MVVVAEYEQATARLGDTGGRECMFLLNTRLQESKTSLQASEAQYTYMTTRHHSQGLHEEPYVPMTSIAELTRVVSAEADALDDLVAHVRTWVRIDKKRLRLEHELYEKQRSKERNEQLQSYSRREETMDDQDIEDIHEDIRHNAERIQSVILEYEHLQVRAYKR